MSKRTTKNQLDNALEILAENLDPVEYSKVTSVMSLLFVGHQFGMSPDGFEFVNLAIKTKKEHRRKRYKKTLQGNVINLKLKR
jgi:hypothetical protein